MVGLWIAEGARAVDEEVLFVEEDRGEIVRAFGHETTPGPTADCLVLGSGHEPYEAELRSADGDRWPRAERWQRTVGWDFRVRRPLLGTLPPDALGWGVGMTEGRPTVVIAPKAAYASRTLPLQKWLRLAWALNARGVRTIAIDGRRETVEQFPVYAHGYDWPHILALRRVAATVVGNDSGIVHVSATLGTPTVAAMGPTDPDVVLGQCLDRVTFVQAAEVSCLVCHFSPERGDQFACEHGCEALQRLSWKALRDSIITTVAKDALG